MQKVSSFVFVKETKQNWLCRWSGVLFSLMLPQNPVYIPVGDNSLFATAVFFEGRAELFCSWLHTFSMAFFIICLHGYVFYVMLYITIDLVYFSFKRPVGWWLHFVFIQKVVLAKKSLSHKLCCLSMCKIIATKALGECWLRNKSILMDDVNLIITTS